MQLHGLHHVTAVTAKASLNLDFYTRVLGLRLVKKSVNQDDVSAYHLFYADKLGSPGTDMTFFDWPMTAANRRGTDSISNTLFRVNGTEALEFWRARFDEQGVKHQGIGSFAGHSAIHFEDPEGQQLTLVDDEGAPIEGELWEAAGIPLEYAIRGFYGVMLSVPQLEPIAQLFTLLLGFEEMARVPSTDGSQKEVVVFGMDGGGPGKEIFVVEERGVMPARLGHGGVHHVAFRLKDDAEQQAWLTRLAQVGVRTSGQVDRYYFKSVYFRISNGILFELATDGPGFATDESLETLGERLALPPFLESQRAQIEANLKPLDTARVSR